MRGFEALEIWQLAHSLTLAVYRKTASFPVEERFGLTAQLRRASSSMGANTAEGYGRHHTQDTIRFYDIARGSLMETRNFVLLARDLDLLPDSDAAPLLRELDRLSIKLSNSVSALTRAKSVREEHVPYSVADNADNPITTPPRERSDLITGAQRPHHGSAATSPRMRSDLTTGG